MSNLVEAHAAAVKPSLADGAVADRRGRRGREGAGGSREGVRRREAAAAKAEALAVAMEPAEPVELDPAREILDDEYLEIARSLERGMWVEFEDDDGQLAFAKLAWVSPLRGTYLFTNRQGQKALSMTAEELAERFRAESRAPGRGRAADRPRVQQRHLRAHRPVRARNRVGLKRAGRHSRRARVRAADPSERAHRRHSLSVTPLA